MYACNPTVWISLDCVSLHCQTCVCIAHCQTCGHRQQEIAKFSQGASVQRTVQTLTISGCQAPSCRDCSQAWESRASSSASIARLRWVQQLTSERPHRRVASMTSPRVRSTRSSVGGPILPRSCARGLCSNLAGLPQQILLLGLQCFLAVPSRPRRLGCSTTHHRGQAVRRRRQTPPIPIARSGRQHQRLEELGPATRGSWVGVRQRLGESWVKKRLGESWGPVAGSASACHGVVVGAMGSGCSRCSGGGIVLANKIEKEKQLSGMQGCAGIPAGA